MTDPSGTAAQGREIARSARSVGAAVLCSRALGLVREQVLAILFGAGTAMDAYVVAFRIPNLLRDLFAEGALSSAFVAVLADYEKNRSGEDTKRLVRNAFTVITVVISAIVIGGMIFSDGLVRLLAPEFAQVAGKSELTSRLTTIMFPFLLFVSQAALFMGILNTVGRFFIPALSSSCFNLGSIIVGGGLSLIMPVFDQPPIIGMAIGTLAGGLFQAGVQLPLLLRHGFTFKPFLSIRDPGLSRIGRLVLPAVIGLSATQITVFVNTNFASRCAEGSVAWLNYAFRFIQLPIGLFGVAISVASLPVLSRLAASRDLEALGKTLVSSLGLAFALTIPASVGLWILAEPIVNLIYEHGRFTGFDTIMTAEAIRFYSIGLAAYAGSKVVVPAFYALNDTRWPVIGSFLSVGMNIGIILLTLDRFQHKAIALSTSATMLANLLLLATALHRKTGGYPTKELANSIARTAAASIVMAFALLAVKAIAPAPEGLAARVFFVSGAVAAGAVVYGISAIALGVTELRGLFSYLSGGGRRS